MAFILYFALTILLKFNLAENCGRSIGKHLDEGAWPWHAAVYRNDVYICGGTLISKKHLITAAHCFTHHDSYSTIKPSIVKIRLGLTNLDKINDSHVGTYSIEQINVHPEFNSTYFINDIAVLRVAITIEFNDYIQPICLWPNGDEIDRIGNIGTVVGWDRTETNSMSKVLKEIRMPVVSRFDCILSNPTAFSSLVNSHNYCAGFRNGTSVCNGDSGSGLYFPWRGSENETIWQLGGLVSFTLSNTIGECDTSNYVGFTDVPKFNDWIMQQIKN